jgi:hypothetical protein
MPTKKDALKISQAKAVLMQAIEDALEGCADVSEYEPNPVDGTFDVDMSHPEACYIPFRVTVSFKEPTDA